MHPDLPGVHHLPLALHRHAANPRGVARAGEIWRLAQEAAVQASIQVGWPPERYSQVGTAFVVYAMTVQHHQEAMYGQPIYARTWVHNFRRGVLTQREVQLSTAAGPLARCSQQWVHVNAALKPARASAELLADFPAVPVPDPPAALPTWTERMGSAERTFSFDVWQTWMDPLGHVNHPAYVDFCDEATGRVLAAAGLDAQALVPVAEHIDWKHAAGAGDRLCVRTWAMGRTAEGAAVLGHRIHQDGDLEAVCAVATSVRRLVGEDGTRILDCFA